MGVGFHLQAALNNLSNASLDTNFDLPSPPLLTTSSQSKNSSSSPNSSNNQHHYFAKPTQIGEFEFENHFYPRVLNAQIHPLVASFFSLGNERIIARFTHLNPQVNEAKLREVLAYKPRYFAWAGNFPFHQPDLILSAHAGCDLFNVTDANGHRQMIVVETNSCPSGQKSMPLLVDNEEYGGYGVVMEHTFRGLLERADLDLGGLAVLYDKNPMEATGYAAVMADLMKEVVHLVEYYEKDLDPPVKWVDRVMHVRSKDGSWLPIRACFRYVTQKPWNRFPLYARTIVLNNIVSCLAGGRNKAVAARAYDHYNAELEGEQSGLQIRMPETIRNVSKNEIPLLIEAMGGHGVLKVPYSNAGQGVYTITNKQELEEFMNTSHHYDKFIVQSLVGNASWSSSTRAGKFYHVGTIPNRRNQTFVCDLRMMVAGNTLGAGFKPVAIYARRARKPLLKKLEDDPSVTSWEMLGTNLSVKLSEQDDSKHKNSPPPSTVPLASAISNTPPTISENLTLLTNGATPAINQTSMMSCEVTAKTDIAVEGATKNSATETIEEPSTQPLHPLWTTETGRLLLMDRKDFNILGIGIDDLIDAYVQTVLSVIAIDKMCLQLMPEQQVTETRERELEKDLTETPPLLAPSFEEETVVRVHDPVEGSTSYLGRHGKIQQQEVFERNGKKFVRELWIKTERKFDYALFEALNPDPVLLKEVLL